MRKAPAGLRAPSSSAPLLLLPSSRRTTRGGGGSSGTPPSEATCIYCKKPAGHRLLLTKFCMCGAYKLHNGCWREMKKSTTWDQTRCPVCDARFQAARGAATAGPPARLQRDNLATAQGQVLPDETSDKYIAPGRPYPTGMPNSPGSYPDTVVPTSAHPFQQIVYSSSAPTFGVPRTQKGEDVGRPALQKSDGKKRRHGHEARLVLQTTTGMAISVSAKEPRDVEDDKASPISLRGNAAGTPEPIDATSTEERNAAHPYTPPTPPSPGEGGAGVKQVLSFSAVVKKLANTETTCFKCNGPETEDAALVAFCLCSRPPRWWPTASALRQVPSVWNRDQGPGGTRRSLVRRHARPPRFGKPGGKPARRSFRRGSASDGRNKRSTTTTSGRRNAQVLTST